MKKLLKRFSKLVLVLAALVAAGALALALMNASVVRASKSKILSVQDAAKQKADCILVLGCGVRPDGTPSPLLRHRLDAGIELYNAGAAPKIIMSGDHEWNDHDEVNVMKAYAIVAGVPSKDVFMDHAGLSTYESMYRARDVFLAESIVIVTQEYHLYRAVYDARKLGLDAYGVASGGGELSGQGRRDAREVLARAKDVVWCAFKPRPEYLGEAIPVSGDGDVTNDREFA